MDFEFTEEQRLLRDTVREFAEKEIAPRIAAAEREGRLPVDLIHRLWRELGLGGMLAPEEHGGLDLDPVSYVLVIEELARVWPALAIMISVHNSVNVQIIARHGNEAQKAEYLPKLTDEWIGAFSLSEPGAGSDVAALRTVATRDGDDYVLNGEKNWVTNGLLAQVYVAFVKTDPAAGNRGISAFIVDRDAPGLTVAKPEKKLGIRASDTISLVFENCRVPAANRIGDEGSGFKIAMMQLDGGRIGVGAQAVGIAQGAFDRAVRYAKEREAFGHPIADFQAIQWMLADMATRLEAARMLTYHAAWLKAAGKPHSREASMAKVYASEMATFVTHKAIQVHGGYGYTEDYEVERYYRDARVTEIYEGTSEIQRLVIARSLLRD